MNDEEYEQVVNAIFIGANGDPNIMTGLPAIDQENDLLRFIRAIEICTKIEAVRDLDEDRADQYTWYENLGENVKERMIQYFAASRFRPVR